MKDKMYSRSDVSVMFTLRFMDQRRLFTTEQTHTLCVISVCRHPREWPSPLPLTRPQLHWPSESDVCSVKMNGKSWSEEFLHDCHQKQIVMIIQQDIVQQGLHYSSIIIKGASGLSQCFNCHFLRCLFYKNTVCSNECMLVKCCFIYSCFSEGIHAATRGS